ncbi:MAG TPA: hypothetical protein VNX01_03945 [Bacteroidia bacterium]|jgi:hypothetical protein|nr:hypothetical protein [Bacteroidia bacterium]
MEPNQKTKQIQFNKGISGLPDKLTATITAEPYYLRIRIINLVFTEGFASAAEITIDITDKDKLIVADFIGTNKFSGFRTIEIKKEYEFITSTFVLTVDDNRVSKFNFHLTFEDINE